jgi:hypothetical protein
MHESPCSLSILPPIFTSAFLFKFSKCRLLSLYKNSYCTHLAIKIISSSLFVVSEGIFETAALLAVVVIEDIENTEDSLDSCLECGLGLVSYLACGGGGGGGGCVENLGLFVSRETTLKESGFGFNLFFAEVVDRKYSGILNEDCSLSSTQRYIRDMLAYGRGSFYTFCKTI